MLLSLGVSWSILLQCESHLILREETGSPDQH